MSPNETSKFVKTAGIALVTLLFAIVGRFFLPGMAGHGVIAVGGVVNLGLVAFTAHIPDRRSARLQAFCFMAAFAFVIAVLFAFVALYWYGFLYLIGAFALYLVSWGCRSRR